MTIYLFIGFLAFSSSAKGKAYELNQFTMSSDVVISDNLSTKTEPNQLDVMQQAMEKNSLLDSIYVDLFLDNNVEKRKWIFDYEEGHLRTRYLLYFGESFSLKLDQSERWTYKKNLQLEEYEAYNSLYSSDLPYGADTVLRTDYVTYLYDDTLLMKRTDYTLGGVGTTGNMVNGEIVYTTTIEYNSRVYNYEYNEQGLLTRTYHKEKHDWSPDTTYYETSYSYYPNGKIKFGIDYRSDDDRGSIEKREYVQTDNSISQFNYRGSFYNVLEIDPDTIELWSSSSTFQVVFDINGRDSVYAYSYHYFSSPSNDGGGKITYFYNNDETLDSAIFYFRGGIFGDDWQEQGITRYSYDANNTLVQYEKDYYDAQYNEWRVQEIHRYFYSSIVATGKGESVSTNELSIFPNPATDQLFVNNANGEALEYRMYDLYGRLVLQGFTITDVIDISNLKSGSYLLKMIQGGSTAVKRFIKR